MYGLAENQKHTTFCSRPGIKTADFCLLSLGTDHEHLIFYIIFAKGYSGYLMAIQGYFEDVLTKTNVVGIH